MIFTWEYFPSILHCSCSLVFEQVEVIDIDSLVESCGRSVVTIDDVRQADGYLEIKDGHTKVNFLKD